MFLLNICKRSLFDDLLGEATIGIDSLPLSDASNVSFERCAHGSLEFARSLGCRLEAC